MSVEQWRPIPGWEDYYEVSDQGRVRSVDRLVVYSDGRRSFRRGQTIRPFLSAKGYRRVWLKRNGTQQAKSVHLLVLTAFVGPRPAGLEGCHNNGDKADCTLANLRWDTRSANAYDKVRHGAHVHAAKRTCPRGHLLAEPNLVVAVKRNGVRMCKACNRAHANVRKAKLRGEPYDFTAWADDHFRRIMDSAASA